MAGVTRFCIVIALERTAPRAAVELATAAARNGFDGVVLSDRFAPWTAAQGQAPFVWAVAAAAAQATAPAAAQATAPAGQATQLPAAGQAAQATAAPAEPLAVHPGVIGVSHRMHPAVVAQASATLADLYPGGHRLVLGAGELINEHLAGSYWPEPPQRIARMFEALEIIRKLFSGKEIRHSGEHFTLEQSRLWTLSGQRPAVLVATSGPVTARRAGAVADGILTESSDPAQVRLLGERMRAGAEAAGRDPASLQLVVRSHHALVRPTDEAGAAAALADAPNLAVRYPSAEVRTTRDFEQLLRATDPAELAPKVVVGDTPEPHVARIRQLLDAGADELELRFLGPDQLGYQQFFSGRLLPALADPAH
nr:LLM class flavin-dependent oxidoreductase [Nakamurella aerolata]